MANYFSSTLLLAFAALQATASSAAEAPNGHRALQPPGFYQVDWEGRAEHTPMRPGQAPVVREGKIDGATGDASERITLNEQARHFTQRGQQPHTFCKKPANLATEAAARRSCPDHDVTVVDANTLIYRSNCPSMQLTRTVKRTDDKIWVIDSVMKMKGGMAGSYQAPTTHERWTRIADACK